MRRLVVSILSLVLARPLVGANGALRHVAAHGGSTSACVVRVAACGLRGLATADAVAEGGVLLYLPEPLLLASTMRAIPVPTLGRALHEHERLAWELLDRLERGDVPAPLADGLPSAAELATPGPAWLWDDVELDALGDRALARNARRRAELAAEFAEMREAAATALARARGRAARRDALGAGALGTREAAIWALAIVTSRTLSATRADGSSAGVLAPVADLMNHAPASPDPNRDASADGAPPAAEDGALRLAVEMDEAGGVRVRALQPITAGAELRFCYAHDCDDAFLLAQFGFQLGGGASARASASASGGRTIDVAPWLAGLSAAGRAAVGECVQMRLLAPDSAAAGATAAAPCQQLGARTREAILRVVVAAAREEAAAAGRSDALEPAALGRAWADAYAALLRGAERAVRAAGAAAAAAAEPAALAESDSDSFQRGGSTLRLSAAWRPAGVRARRLAEAQRYRESQLELLEAELAFALAESVRL
jgi:hypothetical protein